MLHCAESTFSTTDVPTPTVSQFSHLSPPNAGGSCTEASQLVSPRWLSGPAGGPAMFGTSPPPAVHCLASATAAESATSIPEIPWAQSTNASQLTSVDTPLAMGGYQSSARAFSSSCGPSLFDSEPAFAQHVPTPPSPPPPRSWHAVRAPLHASAASVALQDTASSAVSQRAESLAHSQLAPDCQNPHAPAALWSAPAGTGTVVRAARAVHRAVHSRVAAGAMATQGAGASGSARRQPAEQPDRWSAAALVAVRARPADNSGDALPLSHAGMQAAGARVGSSQSVAVRRAPKVACLPLHGEACKPRATGSVAGLRGEELVGLRSVHARGQAGGALESGARQTQAAAPLLCRGAEEGCFVENSEQSRDPKGTVYSWTIAHQADQRPSRAPGNSLSLPLLHPGSESSALLRQPGSDWGIQTLTLGTVSEQLYGGSGVTSPSQAAGRHSRQSVLLPRAHERRRNQNSVPLPRPAASTLSEPSEGSACRGGRSMPPHQLRGLADIERLVVPLPEKPRAVSYGPQHSARRASAASRQRVSAASEAWGRSTGQSQPLVAANANAPPRQTSCAAGRGNLAGPPACRTAKGAWR
jgi:hypothetical protein